jgi:hypothetical protein
MKGVCTFEYGADLIEREELANLAGLAIECETA